MESCGDTDVPASTKKQKTKDSLGFDVRGELSRMTGVDLTRMDGLNQTSVPDIPEESSADITP